jgi:Gpi18-like mannosyltransferase
MESTREKSIRKIIILVSLVLLAIVLRLMLFSVISFDMTKFVSVWYDTFLKIGRVDAFARIFYNYAPAYLYFVDIATLFHFIPKVAAIKLISVIFDFFAAFAGYKIVGHRFPEGYTKWLGFFIILFTPTVFVESGMWGQCDIIFTSFLLWSLFFLLKKRSLLSVVSFSIAVCFKLQAIFFAPIFIILFFQKKIPFWNFLLIPVTYFVSVVPAWLAGGPLGDLLTMYFNQFNTYHHVSMRASNLYIFLTDNNYNLKIYIGMAITAIIVLAYILLRLLKWKKFDDTSLIMDAVFFTSFIPFFLPKMHDRYFFAAALFIIILAIYNHVYIWQAILFQVASLLSYILHFSDWSTDFIKIGAVINLIAIIGLSINFWRYFKNNKNNRTAFEAQHSTQHEVKGQ